MGLSVFSCSILGGIALYQVGILKHLPDPPIPHFDADAVHGSPEAYRIFHTPDALLGLASYSVTACLAGMGLRSCRQSNRWIPVALGSKAALDAVTAASLSLKEATKLHQYSIWSLLVAGATLASLSLALPEMRDAVRAH